MATPVATEKITSPRMLVLLFQVELILQVLTSSAYIIAPVLVSSAASMSGSMMIVLYCCMVACTRLGGKQLVNRSSRVSTAVLLLSSFWSMTVSVLAAPGCMTTVRQMPRLTASRVVVM